VANRVGEKLQRKDIDDALADERFLLLYQPIVALGEDQTRLHIRVEILLRMLDENNQVITPGAFLPAASRFGLITQIDRWAIARVIRSYSHLFMQNPGLVVSLNLSAASVADESLADYIRQLLDGTVVKPEQVCFEMSEATFSHNLANAASLIEQLHEIGCEIAIDNFGSGLASFSALKGLPLDFIKIDGRQVRDICNDEVDLEMVTAMNAMAQLLGIRTVAENVDNESVTARLKTIGFDYAQGYHLGDLQPLDNLGNVVAQQKLGECLLN
jgi:EAL domain-containing protein (putative c-di-GMP-specific phosphodiesterase class I)